MPSIAGGAILQSESSQEIAFDSRSKVIPVWIPGVKSWEKGADAVQSLWNNVPLVQRLNLESYLETAYYHAPGLGDRDGDSEQSLPHQYSQFQLL